MEFLFGLGGAAGLRAVADGDLGTRGVVGNVGLSLGGDIGVQGWSNLEISQKWDAFDGQNSGKWE